MARGVITVLGQVALAREGLFGPTWVGAQLALLTDQNPFTVLDTIGNHTEATFNGYSRKAINWGVIGYDPAPPPGPDVAMSNVAQWNGPGDGTGQQVYGWAIIQSSESGSQGSAGSPILLAAGPLDSLPTELVALTDILPLVANLDFAPTAGAITQT